MQTIKIHKTKIFLIFPFYFTLFFITVISNNHALAEDNELSNVVDEKSAVDEKSSAVKNQSNDEQSLPADLTEVGLASLLNFDIVVTSPGKKQQSLSSTASAVYVLTQEDIRRSGATHVAEVLRLVPGITVARVSASKWAISVRGFTQVFANKLLVLVDGVSIFSPITNGVYWERNELPLHDIERIEVIRGSGAALWGANAVNGIINIVTKSAKETTGVLLSGGGGDQERGFGTLRVGQKVGPDTAYRVNLKYSDRAPNRKVSGGSGEDGWEVGSAELRVDSKLSNRDSLVILGSALNNSTEIRQTVPSFEPPFVDSTSFSGQEKWRTGGGSLHWKREISNKSDFQMKYLYRYHDFDSEIVNLHYFTHDLDLQHRFSPLMNHDLVYGMAYRNFRNQTEGTFAESFDPNDRQTDLFSWFFQDEISFFEKKLHLILGSKFEHNVSTGFETMPNGRLIYQPNDNRAYWLAVSRAVAPPALVFEDVRIPAALIPASDHSQPNTLIGVFGSRDLQSENLLGYELGFRNKFSEEWSIDTAVFYNLYDDIYSIETGQPFFGALVGQPSPSVIVPLELDNKLSGRTAGVEIALEWRPRPWIRTALSYSYIDLGVSLNDSTDTGNADLVEKGTPRNQVALRSFVDLPADTELQIMPRYVSSIRQGNVREYFELDLGLGWHPIKDLELAVFGQNLLHESHEEFVGNIFRNAPIAIRRGVYGRITYSF